MQQPFMHQTVSLSPITGFYGMLLGVCLIWLHPITGSAAGGQSTDRAAQQPTDALSYELVSARLQNLMTRYGADDAIPADIRESQKEAEQWAAQGEYELALTYLDNAIAFFAAGKAAVPEDMPLSPATATWSAELFAGSELWQQQIGRAHV